MDTITVKTERLKGMAEELASIREFFNREYADEFYAPSLKRYIRKLDNISEDIAYDLKNLLDFLSDYAYDVETLERSIDEKDIYSANIDYNKLFEVKSVVNNHSSIMRLANNEDVTTSKVITSNTNKTYYDDALKWANENNLFWNKYNQFNANEPVMRSAAVDMLYALAGRPAIPYTDKFLDVDDSAWYSESATWAKNNGISGGYDGNNFGPSDNISRAQFITMLWRYAGSPKVEENISFSDVNDSKYYSDAIKWACSLGIIKGVTDTLFNPNDHVTRAQAITFLYRFTEQKNNSSMLVNEKNIDDIDESDNLTSIDEFFNSLSTFNVTGDGIVDLTADSIEIKYSIDGQEYIRSYNTIYGKLSLDDFIFDNDLYEAMENGKLQIISIKAKELSAFNKIYSEEKYGGNQSTVAWLVEEKLIKDTLFNSIENKNINDMSNEEISTLLTILWPDTTDNDIQEQLSLIRNDSSYLEDLIANYTIDGLEEKTAIEIIETIRKYYPNATDEDIKNITLDYEEHGCGFMAVANIFANFMGDLSNGEKLFKNRFDFNLVVKDDNKLSYNVETLAIDFFLYRHSKPPFNCDTVSKLHERCDGIYSWGGEISDSDVWINGKVANSYIDDIKNYFANYNIKVNGDWYSAGDGLSSQKELIDLIKEHKSENMVLSAGIFDLEGIEGTLTKGGDKSMQNILSNGNNYKNVGGHAMTITEFDDDDNIIVSSWSGKYKYKSSEQTEFAGITTINFEIENTETFSL